MEIIKIQEKIEQSISNIQIARKLLREMAVNKARNIAEYEKSVAITILRLKNNDLKQMHGLPCENLPATLIEKVARGFCFKEKLESEQADAEYKMGIEGMKALEAELNGYQSILRYSEYSTK